MAGKPTQSEIDRVLNWADNAEMNGTSQYPGMSYEEGVKSAILWITGEVDENPME